MEFPFEGLEVYRKSIELYRKVSRREAEGRPRPSADLKEAILALCQSIVSGTGCRGSEAKAGFFLQAMDQARRLVPLVEGACLDGSLEAGLREEVRDEIEGLIKMLSALARKTREWADKTAGGQKGTQTPATPAVEKNASPEG